MSLKMWFLTILSVGLICMIGTFIWYVWKINETTRKFNKLIKEGKEKEAWEYWDSVNL